MATPLATWYASAAIVMNMTFGQRVLPGRVPSNPTARGDDALSSQCAGRSALLRTRPRRLRPPSRDQLTRIGVATRWSLPPTKPAILLALALAAGAVDAACYLGLGHVFTANMTGNTVLLGIAVASHDGAGAARSASALGGFALGAAAGFGLLRANGGWPARARRVLWLEGLFLALLLVVWSQAGAAPARFWLNVMSAVAKGAQSAAVRASDVSGVNTTYMTSTLINVIARLVLKARGIREGRDGPALPGSAWSTYAIGALGGALAEKAWHSASAAIPLAIVCVVAAAATRAR